MKHILITRFAVTMVLSRESASSSLFRTVPSESPEWLKGRFELFNRYCLPSVQAQTFKDFDWLFLVSPGFPYWKEEYTTYLERYGKILWIEEPFKEAQVSVGSKLNDLYNGWITTTRLDSDDVISNDFMYLLSKYTEKEARFFSFEQGCAYIDNSFFKFDIKNNQFVSYTEFAEKNIKSVFQTRHHMIYGDKQPSVAGVKYVVHQTAGPMWMIVCHGGNLMNHTEYGGVVKNNKNITVLDTESMTKLFTWND